MARWVRPFDMYSSICHQKLSDGTCGVNPRIECWLLAEGVLSLTPSFRDFVAGEAHSLDYSRRAVEQSSALHGDVPLRVNRFQKQLWNEVRNQGSCISFRRAR